MLSAMVRETNITSMLARIIANFRGAMPTSTM